MLLLVSDDEAQDLRFLQPPSFDALSLQQIQGFFSGQSQDVCQVVQPVEHTLAFDDAHATILRDRNLLGLASDPFTVLFKLLLSSAPCRCSSMFIDLFDADLQSCTNWPMVADSDLPSPIILALDPAQASVEYSIAPCWSSLLLAGVIIVSTNVVFVCRRERNWHLLEHA